MTDARTSISRSHRATSWVVAITIGLVLAIFAYERVSDPLPRQQRLQEEAVVLKARVLLAGYVALGDELEIVDPLNKNRVAGKVYIYPAGSGWQVSGHYRRAGQIQWQPWLMTLDENGGLVNLSVQDAALRERAVSDTRLTFKQRE